MPGENEVDKAVEVVEDGDDKVGVVEDGSNEDIPRQLPRTCAASLVLPHA